MTAQTHAQPTSETTPAPARTLQRACACGESAGVSGKCPACEADERLGVQPKLRVNRPGDRWEQEADRIADEVVSERPAPLQGPLPVTPLVQRQTSEEDDEEELRLKASAEAGPASVTGGGAAEAATEAVSGGGRALSPAERAYFEPRLGRDFSTVRVHQDARAGAAALRIGARAYTLGSHIAFAPGQLASGTVAGRRLMAHELVHTLQQGGARHIQRLCTPTATCRGGPVSGSAEAFNEQEEDVEAAARARRLRMTPAEARSGPHAGRAAQLEEFLAARSPALRNQIHGVFIDADVSSGTAGYSWSCAAFLRTSLPAGDPDPHGFASATKDCVFVPPQKNREAYRFNQGDERVGGMSRERWERETNALMTHEATHALFGQVIEPAMPQPPGVTTATCTDDAVEGELSEIVAMIVEFPIFFEAAQAEADPDGPAHRRLERYFDHNTDRGGESWPGALEQMGCKCECDEVERYVVSRVDRITASFTDEQKTALKDELQARMPTGTRPSWPDTPNP